MYRRGPPRKPSCYPLSRQGASRKALGIPLAGNKQLAVTHKPSEFFTHVSKLGLILQLRALTKHNIFALCFKTSPAAEEA